jgi:hypothetical protein
LSIPLENKGKTLPKKIQCFPPTKGRAGANQQEALQWTELT